MISTEGYSSEWTANVQEKYSQFAEAIKNHVENKWGKNVTVVPPFEQRDISEISDTQINIRVMVVRSNTNKCAFDKFTSDQRGGNMMIYPDVNARDFYNTFWQALVFGADTRAPEVQAIRNQLFNFNGKFSLAQQAFVNLIESGYNGIGFGLISRLNYQESSETQHAKLTDDREAQIRLDPVTREEVKVPIDNSYLGITQNYQINSSATSERFQVASKALNTSEPDNNQPPFSIFDDAMAMKSVGQSASVDFVKMFEKGLNAFKRTVRQILVDASIERGVKEMFAFSATVLFMELAPFLAAAMGRLWVLRWHERTHGADFFSGANEQTLWRLISTGYFLNSAVGLSALAILQKTSTGLPSVGYTMLSEIFKPRYYESVGGRAALVQDHDLQNFMRTLSVIKAVADLPLTAAGLPALANYIAERRSAKGLLFPLALSAAIQLMAFGGRRLLMPKVNQAYRAIYEDFNRSVWGGVYEKVRDGITQGRRALDHRQALQRWRDRSGDDGERYIRSQNNHVANNADDQQSEVNSFVPVVAGALQPPGAPPEQTTTSDLMAFTGFQMGANEPSSSIISNPDSQLPIANTPPVKTITSRDLTKESHITLTLIRNETEALESTVADADVEKIATYFAHVKKLLAEITKLSEAQKPGTFTDSQKHQIDLALKISQINMGGLFLHEWASEEKLRAHVGEKRIPQFSECCQKISQKIMPQLHEALIANKRPDENKVQAAISFISSTEMNFILSEHLKLSGATIEKLFSRKKINGMTWAGKWEGNTTLAGATVLITPREKRLGALLKYTDHLIYVTREDYQKYLVTESKRQGQGTLVKRVGRMSKNWKPQAVTNSTSIYTSHNTPSTAGGRGLG